MIDPLIRKLERYAPISEDECRFLKEAPSRIVEYSGHEPIVR